MAKKPLSVTEQAEAFEKEMDIVETDIVKQFDAWISSLEGTKFPVKIAKKAIALITHAVACAGRQLLYEGQPVTLYCDIKGKRRNAKVIVMSIGIQPQERLREKVTVPPLTTRLIP